MNLPAHSPRPRTLTPRVETEPAWFCLRTHCKHEHLAADWVARYLHIECYAPRIRFRRAQKRGLVWFTEALFPNYLFARFDLAQHLPKVEAAPGIRHAVRFGAHCPRVADEVIQTLRAALGSGPVRVLNEALSPGETVQVVDGPLQGLQAVVARVLPGRERISVLLDFLGRQSQVELAAASAVRLEDQRQALFKSQI